MTKIVALLTALLVTGCGYTPRGHLNPSAGVEQIAIGVAGDNPALNQALKRQFALLGMQADTEGDKKIRLSHVQLQRYKTMGVLSEVRLVLSAKASYHVGGDWQSFPVTVSHSYQHNSATLSVDDPEGEQVSRWLYQALASRVAEQYHALH